MLVRHAKAVARQWVENEVGSHPGFLGAYHSGSMSALPDNEVLPTASDVDVKVILNGPDVPGEPQKCFHRDIVLDVSYGSSEEVRSPEAVLGTYYTAVHFAHPCILLDPSGHLTAVQSAVEREYAKREWVRTRSDHALHTLRDSLTWLSPGEVIQDQVLTWLFPIFFTPPMVLVADLRNPTHRRGMATLGQVLIKYGHPELHERVLSIVGSEAMSREQAEALLAACADAFEVAQAVRATPFLLASNISGFARPIAIGGAQELIADGYHREALPWIAFIHTLCQKVLQNDAPDQVWRRFIPAYQRLLLALGVPTYEDLAVRHEQLANILPDLREVADEIIQMNPAIQD